MKIPPKRFRYWLPEETAENHPLLLELHGFEDLGMAEDVLETARRILALPSMSGELLTAVVSALLVHEDDRLKRWSNRLQKAYGRLSKKGQAKARFWLLSFYCAVGNYSMAAQFLLKRFGGDFPLLDLCYAMDTMLALDRLEEAKKLAPKLAREIELAEQLDQKAILSSSLAAYFARIKQWSLAADLWKLMLEDDVMAESAVHNLVELGLVHSYDAALHGLKVIEQFRSHWDPDLERIIPGNEKERWDKVEKFLRKRLAGLKNLLNVQTLKEYGV